MQSHLSFLIENEAEIQVAGGMAKPVSRRSKQRQLSLWTRQESEQEMHAS